MLNISRGRPIARQIVDGLCSGATSSNIAHTTVSHVFQALALLAVLAYRCDIPDTCGTSTNRRLRDISRTL